MLYMMQVEELVLYLTKGDPKRGQQALLFYLKLTLSVVLLKYLTTLSLQMNKKLLRGCN